ncbi:MAG TPA: protein kinase, partial [Pyrinomonadaceae bacterium]|nr:protein kinase [Pyrinomonadaceae bacterium]
MLTTNQILQQGRFRVIQPLSGVDFEAFDDVHQTSVILKQFPVGMKKVMTVAQTELLKKSFADEAKTLMRLQHPSILKIHGWFTEVDANYLVSEFAAGSFLSEMLKRVKKPFPLAEVSNWTEKLLDALGYLHNFAPPLVHRNIKPENIKLTPAGEIKLIISSLTEEVNPGKLNYLPLEQIWSGLDAASQNLIL